MSPDRQFQEDAMDKPVFELEITLRGPEESYESQYGPRTHWRLAQLPAHWFPAGYHNPYVWPDRWCLLP